MASNNKQKKDKKQTTQGQNQQNINKYTRALRSSETESRAMGDVTEEKVTTNELKNLILDLQKDLSGFQTKVERDLSDIKDTVGDLKQSIEFQAKRVDDIVQDVHTLKEQKLEERVVFLEQQLQYQERRSRKYNLLLYGVSEGTNEDVDSVIRDVFQNKLKIDEKSVKGMLIANAHRVPRRSDVNNQPGVPDPIIVKFVQMRDREKVYNARKNLEKGSKVSVRTDLPSVLKKKRGELAYIAYNMRTKDKLQTRIVESRNDVKLLYRRKPENGVESEWQQYVQIE